MVIDSPWLRLYIVLEHSRSPSTQDDYSSYIRISEKAVLVIVHIKTTGVQNEGIWLGA